MPSLDEIWEKFVAMRPRVGMAVERSHYDQSAFIRDNVRSLVEIWEREGPPLSATAAAPPSIAAPAAPPRFFFRLPLKEPVEGSE